MSLATTGILIYSLITFADATLCPKPDLSRPLESAITHCRDIVKDDIVVESAEVTLSEGEDDTLNVKFHMPTIPCSNIDQYYLGIVLFYTSDPDSKYEEYAFRSISLIPKKQTNLVEQIYNISFANIISGHYGAVVGLYRGLKGIEKEKLYKNSNSIKTTTNNTEEYLKFKYLTTYPYIPSNSNRIDYEVQLEPKMTKPYKLYVALLKGKYKKGVLNDDSLACCQSNNSQSVLMCSEGSECLFDGTNLKCSFYVNMTNSSGNAYLQIQFENERCIGIDHHDSHHSSEKWKWGYHCTLYGESFNYSRSRHPEVYHEGKRDWQLVVMIVFLALLLIAAAAFVIIKLTKRFRRSPHKTENYAARYTKKFGNCDELKVLLLYAREDDLQENVNELRLNLQQTLNCEVVDIYHNDYEKVMNEEGFEFLTKLLEIDSVLHTYHKIKIIFIHTNWSVKIYQAHMKGQTLQHKREEYFDSYYLSSLRVLLQQNRNYSYANVFNVEFSDYSVKEPQLLPPINLLAKYTMPVHFDQLCHALKRECKLSKEERESEDDDYTV